MRRLIALRVSLLSIFEASYGFTDWNHSAASSKPQGPGQQQVQAEANNVGGSAGERDFLNTTILLLTFYLLPGIKTEDHYLPDNLEHNCPIRGEIFVTWLVLLYICTQHFITFPIYFLFQ
jgi:hypothetical protein